MEITLEKELSTKDRNSLDNDQFGLPDDRKYPLTDKKHVLSAIQYFRFCEKSKRLKLAKNINKKLKEYDMTVNVSSDNPFYKYIDKNFLQKNSKATESLVTLKKENIDCDEINEKLKDCLNNIDMTLETSDDIIKAEKMLVPLYDTLIKKCDINTSTSFLGIVSSRLDSWYNQYIEFLEYSNNNDDAIRANVIKDCIDSMYHRIDTKPYNVKDDLDISLLRTIDVGPFKYYVIRHLVSIMIIIEYTENDTFRSLIAEFNKPDPEKSDINQLVFDAISSGMRLSNLQSYLERVRRQKENELYIINKYIQAPDHGTFKYLYSTNMITDESIKEKIVQLNTDHVNKDNLNLPRYLTTIIPDTDMIKMVLMDCMNYFVEGSFENGEVVYYAVSGDSLFYIFKNQWKEDSFELLELNDEMIYSLINSEIKQPEIHLLKLNLVENDTVRNKIVNEGFTIDSDGNVTITINPKKSYMDQYSEGHRILVESYKNKQYETVKHGISFMFTLISVIERDKKYKKRDPETVKARAFAINDFKTYLKHVQDVEPKFNFFEFYKENNYDKLVIDVPFTTIMGLKKILKSIL